MAADITGTYLNLNNGYPRGYETDTDSMSPFTLWSPKSSSLYSSTSQHNSPQFPLSLSPLIVARFFYLRHLIKQFKTFKF